MIDVRTEQLISLTALAKELDMTWEGVAQWVNDGRTSKTGSVVKLETRHSTKGRKTSMEAYYRFLEALDK